MRERERALILDTDKATNQSYAREAALSANHLLLAPHPWVPVEQ